MPFITAGIIGVLGTIVFAATVPLGDSQLVEYDEFKSVEYKREFLLAQYFGYLRREPDTAGYDFWLDILTNNPSNYRGMVCAFITSAEYQDRFGAVHTHSNAECSGSP